MSRIALCMLLVLSTLLISAIANAQRAFISIGANAALPSSYGINRVAGTGVGGSFRFESAWSAHVSGMITVEYLKFAEQKNEFNTTEFKAIPVQVGIKYYNRVIGKRPGGFFFSSELGLMPTTTHFTFVSNNPERTYKESGLCLAYGPGYLLGKGEASIRLQHNLSASGFDIYFIAFRLAYAFLRSAK
jgi:hypothetical protein